MNTQTCLYDGGDCCLPKKVTLSCENCTCLFDFDLIEMKAAYREVTAGRYFFKPPFEFPDTVTVKKVTEVPDEDLCTMLCLDKNLTNVNSWHYDLDNETCHCLSSFQEFQCALLLSNQSSETYLNVMRSRTCRMNCHSDGNSSHLHELFTNLWGTEVNYTGCVQDNNLAHGNGKAATKSSIGQLWLFQGDWRSGILAGWATVQNTDSGEAYKGQLSNGLYHGQGELRYPNGDLYIGSFEAGLRSGQGWMRELSGDLYSGDWFQDKRHGNGSRVWHDGDAYHGAYVNDIKEGFGKYMLASGDVYKGQFKNNVPNGNGSYTWSDGSYYEGEFVDHYFHGYGKKVSVSGKVYEGCWSFDMRHGNGITTWPDGSYYEGQFQDGYFHGQGKSVDADGNVYEGDWVLDLKQGNGNYTWTNGDVYIGRFWQDLKQDDNGLLIEFDGTSYQGKWEEDYPVGEHLRTRKNQTDIVCAIMVETGGGFWSFTEDC